MRFDEVIPKIKGCNFLPHSVVFVVISLFCTILINVLIFFSAVAGLMFDRDLI